MRYLVLVILFFPEVLLAQSGRNVTFQRLQWVRYVNQLTLNKAWSVQTEIDQRVFLPSLKAHHLVMRSQLRYALSPGIETGLGFTYALQYPQIESSRSKLVVPELRAQHDITLKHAIGVVKLNHRYMLEERFIRKSAGEELLDGYNFNFRFRYRLMADVPVWKSERRELRVIVFDEAMLNFGKIIERNVFDQNRVYAGVQFGVSPHLAFEIGYLKWFQQRTSGIDFYNRDITRLSIYHKIKRNKNVI